MLEGLNVENTHGITFYLKADKKPDFTVQIAVMFHDDRTVAEQSWTWILGYPGDPSPLTNQGTAWAGWEINRPRNSPLGMSV